MRFAVVVFPGSNCDADCYHAVGTIFQQQVEYVWHADRALDSYDCVILPGGFSYGDHLRAGAIARFAPIMNSVERFAASGGLVIGICNGFQILCEAGLLPGALLRNDCLQFRCEWVHLRVESASTPVSNAARQGQVLRMPIAHGDGRYYADEATLAQLNTQGQIVLRYCDPTGAVTPASNPNGSLEHIAGIVNTQGNVFGLMPHPERCCERELGGVDGRLIFESILSSIRSSRPIPAPTPR